MMSLRIARDRLQDHLSLGTEMARSLLILPPQLCMDNYLLMGSSDCCQYGRRQLSERRVPFSHQASNNIMVPACAGELIKLVRLAVLNVKSYDITHLCGCHPDG